MNSERAGKLEDAGHRLAGAAENVEDFLMDPSHVPADEIAGKVREGLRLIEAVIGEIEVLIR